MSLIDVDYEELVPVLTAPEGMSLNTPHLHDDLMTEELGEQTDKARNLAQLGAVLPAGAVNS